MGQPVPRPNARSVRITPSAIALGARRCELDHAPVVTGGEVGVEPPTQAAVKALGAIDVCNRDDDDLELQVDRPCGGCDISFDHSVGLAHDGLLWCPLCTFTPGPPLTSPRRSPDRTPRAACLFRRYTWQAPRRCRYRHSSPCGSFRPG